MTTIRIRKRVDSDTLHLPELKAFIGKTVEIVVVEQPAAPAAGPFETRDTMFARMPKYTSLTPEERAAMLADPTFQALWPLLSDEGPADLDVDAIFAARNADAP